MALVLANRTDGSGSRLNAFLNALYIAQYLGDLSYAKILWIGSTRDNTGANKNHIIGSSLDKVDKIFSQNFINTYCIHTLPKDTRIIDVTHFKSLQSLKDSFFSNKYDYFITPLGSLAWYFHDINRNKYRAMTLYLWKKLDFLPEFNYPISKAYEDAGKIGDFIAIHFRSGDVIYDYFPIRKHNFLAMSLASCCELILSLIQNELLKNKNQTIVIIGDDLDSIQKIIDFHNNPNIVSTDKLRENDTYHYNKEFQLFLYDIIFLSQAKKIYTTGSALTKIAYLLGNADYILSNNIFTPQECYKNFKQFYGKIIFSPMQRAYSLFQLFLMGSKTYENISILKIYLLSALDLDPDNDKYRIYFLVLLLQNNEWQEAEFYLQNILNTRKEEFLETLFFYTYIGYVYQNIFNSFLSINASYPSLFTIKQKIQSLKLLNLSNDSFSINLRPLGAPYRFKSHLSYKLGQALILNSKSLLGYIRMPYVLSYIKDKHKQEQKEYQEKIKKNPSLKLPTLESYRDYKDALKIKNTLSYKLGEALIKADSSGGGGRIFAPLFAYITFFKEVRKLKREFRDKQIRRKI
ncbi:hypothetical protein [Helicobacter apodemus]|uniref:hypothetical protein n=1 Tax=Helicobacter apodemus TaxID=135569 RepID=UPI001EF2BC8B|nr:hypothetical protein [Helicobacter apodemus]